MPWRGGLSVRPHRPKVVFMLAYELGYGDLTSLPIMDWLRGAT